MINIDNEQTLLTTGVWAEYEGSRLLIAHMSNPSFQRAVMRKQAPYKSRIEKGTLDPAISRDLMCKSMSEALILDWEKVVDSAGAAVAFSKDACYKALKNNEGMRDFVSEFAMNLDNFREAEKEALGKS
jgi:hypothetical protein